jgi:hypothetical protein
LLGATLYCSSKVTTFAQPEALNEGLAGNFREKNQTWKNLTLKISEGKKKPAYPKGKAGYHLVS